MLHDLLSVRSPLSFLILEGEVNTSLSFVSDNYNLLFENKIDNIPAYVPFLEMNVQRNLIKHEFIEVKNILDLNFESFDVKFSFNIVEFITDPLFAFKDSWFLKNNKTEIIRYFNHFFILNKEEKGMLPIASLRDFNKFLLYIEKVGIRDIRKLKDLDYKLIW